MLHILLLIIKIIGIILLTILGILILSLCVVFLVPLRYQISAWCKDDLKNAAFELKFSWLIHLINGQVVYENEKLNYIIRILWKKISDDSMGGDPSKTKTAIKKEKEIEPENIVDDILKKNDPEKIVDRILGNSEKKEEKKTEKNTESDRRYEKLKCTIKSICDKIKKIIKFLKVDAHQNSFERIKKEFLRLLGFLKPKKMRGEVHFGMEDPYRTGQILAGLSVLYPLYGKNIDIYPDFGQKILEGDVYIKGHVRGVYALIVVIHLLADKNVRITIQDIKTLLSYN